MRKSAFKTSSSVNANTQLSGVADVNNRSDVSIDI
jgi:hypothetical protein